MEFTRFRQNRRGYGEENQEDTTSHLDQCERLDNVYHDCERASCSSEVTAGGHINHRMTSGSQIVQCRVCLFEVTA